MSNYVCFTHHLLAVFHFLISHQFSSDCWPLCPVNVGSAPAQFGRAHSFRTQTCVRVYLQQGSRVRFRPAHLLNWFTVIGQGVAKPRCPCLDSVCFWCFSGDVKTSGGIMSGFRGYVCVWSVLIRCLFPAGVLATWVGH